MFEEIFSQFYKQALKSKHPAELAWILIHPVIGILSIGIFALFLSMRGAPANSLFFVVVGAVMWDFYSLSQKAITYGIMYEIWDGSLKHMFMSKTRIWQFLVGNALFGLVSSVVASILVALIAFAVFGFNIFSSGIFLVVGSFSIFTFAIAVGIIITSFMMWKSSMYMSLTWMMTGLVMVFSGVYYPVQLLPEPIRTLALLLPSSHAIQGIRSSLGLSEMNVASELTYSLILSGIYLACSLVFFNFALKKARQLGNIDRF